MKAYLLGFFVADGCVYDDARMGIFIQAGDRYIAELFKRYVCPGQNISEKPQKKKKDQILLRWTSRKMVADLKCLGVEVRKTYKPIKTMDYVPEVHKRHFVRGIIDGDGYTTKGIVITNRSVILLRSIQSWFSTFGVYSKVVVEDTCSRLVSWRKEDRNVINLLLTHNSNAYLRRKWSNT